MKSYIRLTSPALILLFVCLAVVACEKKKEGKVEVVAQEFVLRADSDHSYVIDAKGKIKNTGEVDVKNIVVTSVCKSCSEIFAVGIWFITGSEGSEGSQKNPEQKDTINYLPAGKEAEFNFQEAAYMMVLPKGSPPTSNKPDQIEVVVESFETVDK
ncbi:MAG: hypothetical protein C4518_10025 [Desulfobacteraceae bacterium]|nr:MAG: hypothetical protein C4518_10025 [Desulfobacteraceae bacterium]